MLKALIAVNNDRDREHILELVNWGMLGYEIIGHCRDGIEAMESIFKQWPDLVLADYDLSQMNGIELIERVQEHGLSCDFVILSETGSFEVARHAMRLGVEEYLIKPVSRDELTRVLDKYVERRRALDGRDINEHFLRTRRLLRNSFMERFIAQGTPRDFTIESMNQKYHFMLREGIFQAVIIVLDGLPQEEKGVFRMAVVENVRARFDPVCYEMIPYVQEQPRVSFIFNYSEESHTADRLTELLSILQEHLNKRGCSDAVFSIGVGLPESDFRKLKQVMETAERAVRCGILRGLNKMYFYGELEFDKLTSVDILTQTLMSEIKGSAEALDIKGFEHALRSAFSPISPKTNPAIMIDICWAAVEAVAEVCKMDDDDASDSSSASISAPDSDSVFASTSARKEIYDRLGSQTTISGTISSLVEWTRAQFLRCKKEREYARPVREAKHYIEKHCTQPITLERVAEQVHLNASYFSTIFKKETGQNFSEYLANCRISEAKRLLRESNLSIAQICSVVGYTDNKHFSRIFTKLVGVKPSVYRSLHG